MLDDMFFTIKGYERAAATGTVKGYCRQCNIFLTLVEPVYFRLEAITVFQMASFLRDRQPLGKTVPKSFVHVLKWFRVCTGDGSAY